MAKILHMFDGLRNAITGQGTGRDPRTASQYAITRPMMTQQELAAAYRGSGIMRKIVNIPALDMVREWREWEAEKDQIETLEKEEKRLGIVGKVHRAEVLRACGGGALILGLPGLPNEPAPAPGLNMLAYVNVVSRWHLTFDRLNDDATTLGYGEPVMWRMNTTGGQVDIHPSRVIAFRGAPVPPIAATLNATDEFWGESIIEQVLDAVQDSDTARGAFASLLHKARLTRIGIPGLAELVATPEGEAQLSARLSVLALAESMYNAAVYDRGNGGTNPGEQIDDVSYNFAGAKDVIDAYARFVCAVSDIPATRLLGESAGGLNASGTGEQQDWAKKIKAKQELELAPCLDRLDAYIVPSALGSYPDGVEYDFEELLEEDETANVARFKTVAEALTLIQNTAAIPEIAFVKAAQNTLVEGGWMPGLSKALDEMPESERWGISPDLSIDPMGNPVAPGAGLEAAPGAMHDAAPRTLYVQRKLINAHELATWAKDQGFNTTLSTDEMHVTIAYSSTPVDWMKVGQDWHGDEAGKLTVPAGGARLVEPLGDGGAVVLLFTSSALSWRNEAIREVGASWDHAEYQPHVTITYDGNGVDLSKVDPFRGKLEFGPEIFEELNLDWRASIGEA